MATGKMSGVIQHLRRVLRDGAGLTDGQLLEDYISHRDEAAFAVLVRRHGPMVWGVCRRVLRNHHAAEDAFQATFLVLVRRAASIASRELLANWLYGVAHQTALKARATAAKRKGRERQMTEMPEPAVTQSDEWRDLQPVLDEELSRLPDHYRGVIVLCDLEGMTRREAARQLSIPAGSVASRLARARVLLAKRLTQRGVVFSGGSVAAVLSAGSASALVPPALVASTIKAANLLAAGRAAAMISAKVATLTEGVVKTMFVTKIKSVLAVLLVVAALAGAVGLIYQTQAGELPLAKDEQPAVRNDRKTGEEKPPLTKEEKLRVLIDKVLAAHGGEDKLNKLQFTMTVKHSNGYINHYFVQPPKNFRWEQQHRDQTSKTIVILSPEGRRWWTKEPNADAKEFIPTGIEPAVEYWHDNVKFFGPRQVLRLKDADHKVALLDEEAKIGDRAAIGVEVTGPHFKGKMYFDKETHLLVKRSADSYYRSQGFIIYSDYKKFDGIPIAQKEDDGYFMPEVTDFRVVDKFDDKLFEQPEATFQPKAKEEPPAKLGADEQPLQGTWKAKKVDGLGKSTRGDTLPQEWVCSADNIVIHFKDGATEEWTYKIDSTTKPRSINLEMTKGVKAGAKVKGIYEIQDGTLRISFNGDGKRPSDFGVGDLGDSRFARIVVLERVPAAKPEK